MACVRIQGGDIVATSQLQFYFCILIILISLSHWNMQTGNNCVKLSTGITGFFLILNY